MGNGTRFCKCAIDYDSERHFYKNVNKITYLALVRHLCSGFLAVVAMPIAFQIPAVAQSGGSFDLGSGSVVSGTTLTLPIVYLSPSFLMTGSAAPASAQLSLTYSSPVISGVSIAADPALATAGKSISCASPTAGTINCVVFGMNATPLATGVVAEATFTASSPVAATSAVNVGNVLGASPTAVAMAMLGAGGTVSVTPAVGIQSLSCVPAVIGSGQSTSCTASITGQHAATQIAVASTSPALTAPTQVSVASGAATASFSATATQVTSNAPAQLSAALNGVAGTANIQLLPPAQPSGLSCGSTAAPGTTVLCALSLNGLQQSAAALTVSSSTASVKVPATVWIRPGQSTVWFNAIIDPAAPTQAATITATLGSASVLSQFGIQAVNPVVVAPVNRSFPAARGTSFVVTASDPQQLPLKLSVSNLPAGATFNPSTGTFLWVPSTSQVGMYQVTFTATDTQGLTGSATSNIEVGTGVPFLTGIVNAASGRSDLVCSPGSVAAVHGVDFGSKPVVIVNGAAQFSFYGNENSVDFACPALAAGTAFSVQVQNSVGTSAPINATVQAAAPGIYTWSLNGTGTGQAYFANTATKVTIPDYLTPSESPVPGDAISIYVTGINPAVSANSLTIAGTAVPITSIVALAGQPGNYKINCTIPANMTATTAAAVVVTTTAPDNSTVTSNTATLPIAPTVL